MIRLILSVCLLFFLSACGASIKQYGHRYFHEGANIKGVESVDMVIARMKKERTLQEMMYGQKKTQQILQCTLLRNQLYVAALKNGSGAAFKDIKDRALLMERAYQQDDESFLSTCQSILSEEIGKIFLVVQQEYLFKKQN